MFTASVLDAIRRRAEHHGWPFAALAAVVDVESNGVAFALVDGRKVPLIRIEGHYFFRLLAGEKRDRAVAEGLAHPKSGRVKNPKDQKARYLMLERMRAIDADAADMSCSWGVGQVMGEHAGRLGFDSVSEFRRFVMGSIDNQVEIMCRYIVKFGLADELLRQDWAGFARGYNGPAYKKYAYHTKMAKAFRHYVDYAGERIVAPVKPATGMLRMGSEGARVRELQVLLRRAGYTVTADGDFGPSTKDAVLAYQAAKGLTADGVAGPETLASIKNHMEAYERPGIPSPLEIPEAKPGAGGIGGAIAVETAKEQINDVLISNGTALPDWIVVALSSAAGALALAGLGFWAYGFVKSRRTVEQPGEALA